MRSQAKPAARNAVLKIPPPNVDIPHSGILLFDMALNPIASDYGAAGILNEGDNSQSVVSIPEDVLQVLRNRRPADRSSVQMSFSIGRNRYSYRTYLVRSDHPALPSTMIAVHIQADANGIDPITKLAVKHHLTEREAQALRGIALGLSTKELATRMNISPNTVKAFIRLIMIKLGVTTRTSIIVKLLEKDETE